VARASLVCAASILITSVIGSAYSPRTPPSGFALYLPGTGRFSRTRLGHRLPPGGEVRRLPDDPALLCGTRANQIAHDDEAAGDAQPHI
jgi:hypothetical protein